jgi:hypothetical protein
MDVGSLQLKRRLAARGLQRGNTSSAIGLSGIFEWTIGMN